MLSKFTLFAALTGMALSAAVPSPDAAYADNVVVTEYADGVPAELKPQFETRDLEKRANSGVFLCTNSFFNGQCVHIVAPDFQCVNLSGDLNDLVSSLGPDGGSYCLFYRAFNCNDSEGHFGTFAPGYNDLSTIGFNDAISSYICHPN